MTRATIAQKAQEEQKAAYYRELRARETFDGLMVSFSATEEQKREAWGEVIYAQAQQSIWQDVAEAIS